MVSITTEMEPSFLGLGPNHLAVGMNNRIWFYKINSSDSTKLSMSLLGDQEYLGSIKNVCINSEFISVLFEGRIQIHTVCILIIKLYNIKNINNESQYLNIHNSMTFLCYL
jgi:WD repeat-containing protein 19